MSAKRRATQFEDLPEEIVVDQILIRLPSKDVGRCRAVSTSWRSATSTPQFMLEHRRRQPLLPIIEGRGCWPSSYVVYRDTGARQSSQQLGASASSQQLWPYILGEKNCVGHGLFAACDGFLIVSRQHRFYICNPVIRKHALLPLSLPGQGSFSDVIGFYRHHPTGEYRVLSVSVSNYTKFSLYSLTVGSNELRHVTVTMPAVSSPSVQVEHKLLKELLPTYCSPPPVHHRGSLHWCRDGANDITEGGGDIIVFDTEAESFRWMRSPAQLCSERRLFDMKGTLAFWGKNPDSTAINVWMMQDYEAEIWAFKYRIDLSTVEASRALYKASLKNKRKKKTPLDSAVELFDDMAVLNERELLIKFNGKHVLRCGTGGKFLGIVHLGKSQYRMELTQHRFQESIVPIP